MTAADLRFALGAADDCTKRINDIEDIVFATAQASAVINEALRGVRQDLLLVSILLMDEVQS